MSFVTLVYALFRQTKPHLCHVLQRSPRALISRRCALAIGTLERSGDTVPTSPRRKASPTNHNATRKRYRRSRSFLVAKLTAMRRSVRMEASKQKGPPTETAPGHTEHQGERPDPSSPTGTIKSSSRIVQVLRPYDGGCHKKEPQAYVLLGGSLDVASSSGLLGRAAGCRGTGVLPGLA